MPVDGPQYPANLIVAGKRCLVVGGGSIAARKIEGLLACGAIVHVIATEVRPDVRTLDVTWEERPYATGDVAGYRLVVTATDQPSVNHAVYEDGENNNIWVNAADDPASCSFTLPAIVRRGPLMVTVSTGGHSPALATWLKQHVSNEMGPEYETLLTLLSEQRQQIKAAGRSTEDLDWNVVLRSDLLDLVKSGQIEDARARLLALTTAG